MTALDVVLLAALIALLAIAAFLALAEVALLRIPRVRVTAELEPEDPTGRRIIALLDELPVVLNTVLLVVLFVQVTAAAVSSYLAQRWFGGVAVTAAAVVVTIVLFIYAEVIPKTLALRSPLQSARLVARPTGVLVRVVRPLTSLLLGVADLHLPGTDATGSAAFSEEELRLLVEESARAGEIEANDVELVERSFDFGDLRVSDVYVPRGNIVAVEAHAPLDDALELALRYGHRRLLVCNGGLDRAVGVVRLRDLAAAPERSAATVSELVSSTLSVSPDDPLADVLATMQQTGARFAVVAGRGGATEGIVTIEDLVAELAGEIEEDD